MDGRRDQRVLERRGLGRPIRDGNDRLQLSDFDVKLRQMTLAEREGRR
jgi:hypothetical protein